MRYNSKKTNFKFRIPLWEYEAVCPSCGIVKQRGEWPWVHEVVLDLGSREFNQLPREYCPVCEELVT